MVKSENNPQGSSAVLEDIYETFLCSFSREGINWLLRLFETSGYQEMANFHKGVLQMSQQELQMRVLNPYWESNLPFVNTYLWKQQNGEISKISRLCGIGDGRDWPLWIIHRTMYSLGYDYIVEQPFLDYFFNEPSTHSKEVNRYLGFHRRIQEYANDDYFSYLAGELNVFGPRLIEHPRLDDIREFLDYIIENIDKEPQLQYLYLVQYVLLSHDLSYPPERTWPACSSILAREIGGFPEYLGFLVAIRMYGEKAKKALRRHQLVERYGGFALLEALAEL